MDAVTEDVLTIDLGKGREYPLNFPIAPLQQAKKKYGTLKKLLEAIADNADEVLPTLAAAGIGEPDITAEWIAKNVNFPILYRQNGKIMAAFTGKTKSEYEAELAEKDAEVAAKKAQAQPA